VNVLTALGLKSQPEAATAALGFGTAGIGGYDYGHVDDRTSIDAVRRALDLGVVLFDTADVYGLGHAETVLSQALGGRRHDVMIATKVGVCWDDGGRTARNLSPDYLERALHDSLRRLRIDSIPLYQVHWPDPEVPVETTLESLRRLQQQGKIQRIGCCNVDLDWVERAQTVCRVDAIQVPFSLVQREWIPTMVECRRRFSMATLAYNVLGQGLLTGKFQRGANFETSDLRSRSHLFQGDAHERGLRALDAVRDVAARRSISPAQVTLRWTMEQPFVDVALAGCKTPTQVDDNAGSLSTPLTADDLERLNNL
jgi:aryl-alcohol dehydrogenase-like predicted oxidoreductase